MFSKKNKIKEDENTNETFWFKDNNGASYRNWTDFKFVKAAGLATAALFTTAAGCSGTYSNEARQVSLEVEFGKVVDQENTPGLKLKTPFISDRFAYSLAKQTTKIPRMEKIRTGDDIKMDLDFTVEWEIIEDTDVSKLYFDLKDRGGDLENVLEVRAKDAAVQVMETMTIDDIIAEAKDDTADEISFTERLKGGIHTRLQEELQSQGWPVRIMAVYTNGYSFTQKSEARLEEIVGIRQESVKLGLREENAQKAKEVFREEAQADAAYLQGLREAGVPEEDLAYSLCLKMNRDAGVVNQKFATSCASSGTAVSPVVK